ncbi:MAG: hypothetical protein IPK08_13775 [Bacteroidetes bacterium]|nr:hypothetical protein [Bacteroidota bacterium]MBK8415979.1 hypothetical protein [Bacteroidota bacterium]
MELNDYYKILGLKYKFTAFELLNKYFERTKLALNSENKEEFINVRMGFEVLRDFNATDDYNRIYRKYILNETLNFPEVREQQMIATFRVREQMGVKIAEQVILKKETYIMHRLEFILQFVIHDLLSVIGGASGIVFVLLGLIFMVLVDSEYGFLMKFIIGGLFVLMGIYFFRRNTVNQIMIG